MQLKSLFTGLIAGAIVGAVGFQLVKRYETRKKEVHLLQQTPQLSPCGNKDLQVSTNYPFGVQPETFVLCSDTADEVTWTADPKDTTIGSFVIDFDPDPNDHPFPQAELKSSSGATGISVTSGPPKGPSLSSCYDYYKYTITILRKDGTKVTIEPHGIVM